jgi:hypothetical protein
VTHSESAGRTARHRQSLPSHLAEVSGTSSESPGTKATANTRQDADEIYLIARAGSHSCAVLSMAGSGACTPAGHIERARDRGIEQLSSCCPPPPQSYRPQREWLEGGKSISAKSTHMHFATLLTSILAYFRKGTRAASEYAKSRNLCFRCIADHKPKKRITKSVVGLVVRRLRGLRLCVLSTAKSLGNELRSSAVS